MSLKERTKKMSNFRVEGEKIFSEVTGDLVATIEDGAVKMQHGKNAMTRKVREFYEEFLNGKNGVVTVDNGVERNVIEPEEEVEEEVNTHFLDDELNRDHVVFGDAPRVGTTAPVSEKKEPEEKSLEQLSVWDIPESSLPEFSPALGVSTPGFKDFVKKHGLIQEQIAELVKRLERKCYGV